MKVEELLVGLRKEVGSTASAIVSRDGMVEAADLPEDVSRETFSIMCAAIMGAGTTAMTEFGRASLRSILLTSEDVHIVLYAAGRKSMLAIVLPSGADMAVVEMGAKRLIERVSKA